MNGLDERTSGPSSLSSSLTKRCCAAVYDSDAAKLLLGDSFHPGGTRLTERLNCRTVHGGREYVDVTQHRDPSQSRSRIAPPIGDTWLDRRVPVVRVALLARDVQSPVDIAHLEHLNLQNHLLAGPRA
jgi:hypothetical protein